LNRTPGSTVSEVLWGGPWFTSGTKSKSTNTGPYPCTVTPKGTLIE
jgi:hypothetical protein